MPPHDNKNIDDDVSDTILGNLMTINWVSGMAVRPFKWQRSICLVSANYTNKATTERKLLNYLTAIADTVC